jgi:uncharacterized membrane protein YphA (DoxX/SURF4 family)
MSNRHMASAYWSLRIALGVVPIVAGLDKFTNLLADWQGYLGPIALRVIPVSPAAFMDIVGIVEVVVGLAILLGRARVFGFVACAWLAAISLNLLTTGHFLDVAARDAVMAVAAFALGRLAQVAEQPAEAARAAVSQRAAEVHA